MFPEKSQPASAYAVSYDEGLRRYFQRIYNTMSIGLVLTGLIAFFVSSTPALVNFFYGNTIMHIVVMFAPLAFVFFGFTPRRIQAMTTAALATTFYAFSAVFGISMAYIFLAYTGESIARVFFITAGMFAATSIFGYTTKKNLAGLQGLLITGVIGLLVAIVVNMFLQSSMLQFVISVVGVLVYTGLIAWDTQNLKGMYNSTSATEANEKAAIMGALSLYINFIMLFQFLLNLLGNSRQ